MNSLYTSEYLLNMTTWLSWIMTIKKLYLLFLSKTNKTSTVNFQQLISRFQPTILSNRHTTHCNSDTTHSNTTPMKPTSRNWHKESRFNFRCWFFVPWIILLHSKTGIRPSDWWWFIKDRTMAKNQSRIGQPSRVSKASWTFIHSMWLHNREQCKLHDN